MPGSNTIKTLPFWVYATFVTAIALVGLGDAIYLSISHYRNYTDMAYSSFCAVSQAINCDTVSQSSHSIFVRVPVPVWGVWGYSLFIAGLGLAVTKAAQRCRMWAVLTTIALVFSLHSGYLAYVATVHIRSLCLMCLLSYAVNFLLLFLTWLVRRRFESTGMPEALTLDAVFISSRPKLVGGLVAGFLAVGVATVASFPQYWHLQPPPLAPDVPTGVTAEGYPWIGSKNPFLTIEEFSDYQCFQCNKVHFYLRHIVQNNAANVRLVHRHFPMDHKINPLINSPLHVRAAGLAMLAIYAQQQNRFWPLNDLLFDYARRPEGLDLKMIARRTGLPLVGLQEALKSPKIYRQLSHEVHAAIKLGVTGTPAFLVDGKLYFGQLPPEIIQKALR